MDMDKKKAKVALGELMLRLRQQGNMKMADLSSKCLVPLNEIHKMESGKGNYPEDRVRLVLTELFAVGGDERNVAEVYLRVIYPPAVKKPVMPSPEAVQRVFA